MAKAIHTMVLVLDEIDAFPLAMQAKLLHVLDDGGFMPVGGRKRQFCLRGGVVR